VGRKEEVEKVYRRKKSDKGRKALMGKKKRTSRSRTAPNLSCG
jgi:hypothetical protein